MGLRGNSLSPCDLLLTVFLLDDFTARSLDELSLSKGDRVELVERDDEFGDGWYLGKHLMNGNTGLFPEGQQDPLLPQQRALTVILRSSVYETCSSWTAHSAANVCVYSKITPSLYTFNWYQ
jgi:hypothetical protein